MNVAADLEALYTRRIRDLAAQVCADKRLVPAEATATRVSRVCGSAVTLDLRRDGGKIGALGWRTRACALGMASTALVLRHAPGRSFAEAAEVAAALRRLLDGEEAIFPEPWGELRIFAAARAFPTRRASILLPFDALSELDGRGIV